MKKAGDIITALFREKFSPDFLDTARSTAGLFSSWVHIVKEVWPQSDQSDNPGFDDPPAAAVHSRIRELERGILLIEADHPGWIQILQTKQNSLLSAAQRRYPELDIRGIAFRLSREPFPSTEAEKKSSNAVEDEIAEPIQEDQEPFSTAPDGPNAPEDEDFYAALSNLKKSIKERNRKNVI